MVDRAGLNPTTPTRKSGMRTIRLLFLVVVAIPVIAPVEVTVERAPDDGIQPKLIVDGDGDGDLHLGTFHGDPKGGDYRYRTRSAGADAWSEPVRVNSQAGSVIAIGTVRGPDLALGRDGWVHAAWMGSQAARPRGPEGGAPMLSARAQDGGGFSEQRNLASRFGGLDGGGAVAADAEGNVWVVWHGHGAEKGERARRVFVAHSGDDGGRFADERPVEPEPKGACACCGISAGSPAGGELAILYRTAFDGGAQRDLHLLLGATDRRRFSAAPVSRWRISGCPMSTSDITPAAGTTAVAWQEEDRVYASLLNDGRLERPLVAPGEGKARKHPAAAVDDDGNLCLVWTEGTAWKKGGHVVWQVFAADGAAVADTRGRRKDLPVWSRPTVAATGEGFLILY